jgi:hypothetical protein
MVRDFYSHCSPRYKYCRTNPRGLFPPFSRNYLFDQKYVAKDGTKYQRLEYNEPHARPAGGLLDEGQLSFGGLNNHFGHGIRRFMGGGGEDEAPRDPANSQENGAHVQLTRRFDPTICRLLNPQVIGVAN